METNKYANGKIYKIISPSHPELVYFGSTVQALSRRMSGHRRDNADNKLNIQSKQILKYDDAKIILVQSFPCDSKEELTAKEAEYIKNNDCVNKVVPGRTGKEYRDDNKEKLEQNRKKYYDENKIELNQKNKIYRESQKQRLIEYDKAKYEKNREEILKKKKDIVNSEEFKQKRKAYLEANKEAIKQRQREYNQRKKNERSELNKQ